MTADAANRSWRTLLQGLVVTVATAVVTVAYDALTASGDVATVDWGRVQAAATTAAAMAALSYLWRVVLDPSKIPSAQPPSDRAG